MNLVKQEKKVGSTIVTAVFSGPAVGYGRIVRRDDDSVDCIIEQKDIQQMSLLDTRLVLDDGRIWTPRQLDDIGEWNSGIYAFNAEALWGTLAGITSQTAQAEYYLTDVVRALDKSRYEVKTCVVPARWVKAVNDVPDLRSLLEDRRDEIRARLERYGYDKNFIQMYFLLAAGIEPEAVIEAQAEEFVKGDPTVKKGERETRIRALIEVLGLNKQVEALNATVYLAATLAERGESIITHPDVDLTSWMGRSGNAEEFVAGVRDFCEPSPDAGIKEEVPHYIVRNPRLRRTIGKKIVYSMDNLGRVVPVIHDDVDVVDKEVERIARENEARDLSRTYSGTIRKARDDIPNVIERLLSEDTPLRQTWFNVAATMGIRLNTAKALLIEALYKALENTPLLIVKDRYTLHDNGPLGHARRGIRAREPAIWIGELSLRDLTSDELAQFLIDEGLHIAFPDYDHDVIKHNKALFDKLEQSAIARGERVTKELCIADMAVPDAKTAFMQQFDSVVASGGNISDRVKALIDDGSLDSAFVFTREGVATPIFRALGEFQHGDYWGQIDGHNVTGIEHTDMALDYLQFIADINGMGNEVLVERVRQEGFPDEAVDLFGEIGNVYQGIVNKRALWLAELIHDIGKAGGEEAARIHPQTGLEMIEQEGLLEGMGLQVQEIELIKALVRMHAFLGGPSVGVDSYFSTLFRIYNRFEDESLRREFISCLFLLTVADSGGRIANRITPATLSCSLGIHRTLMAAIDSGKTISAREDFFDQDRDYAWWGQQRLAIFTKTGDRQAAVHQELVQLFNNNQTAINGFYERLGRVDRLVYLSPVLWELEDPRHIARLLYILDRQFLAHGEQLDNLGFIFRYPGEYARFLASRQDLLSQEGPIILGDKLAARFSYRPADEEGRIRVDADIINARVAGRIERSLHKLRGWIEKDLAKGVERIHYRDLGVTNETTQIINAIQAAYRDEVISFEQFNRYLAELKEIADMDDQIPGVHKAISGAISFFMEFTASEDSRIREELERRLQSPEVRDYIERRIPSDRRPTDEMMREGAPLLSEHIIRHYLVYRLFTTADDDIAAHLICDFLREAQEHSDRTHSSLGVSIKGVLNRFAQTLSQRAAEAMTPDVEQRLRDSRRVLGNILRELPFAPSGLATASV